MNGCAGRMSGSGHIETVPAKLSGQRANPPLERRGEILLPGNGYSGDTGKRTNQKEVRHVCYAYMLGAARKDFRANDNGEPSGTAGKPILGQISSNELTDILIIVVRYFGGIKLGTSGLIVAYKAAAAEAIAAATIIEKTVDEDVTVMFEYPFMNDVMRIVKEEEPEILNQSYDMDCSMTLRIRRSMMPKLRARLEKVETARILDDENIL